jgi:hypothetical protein
MTHVRLQKVKQSVLLKQAFERQVGVESIPRDTEGSVDPSWLRDHRHLQPETSEWPEELRSRREKIETGPPLPPIMTPWVPPGIDFERQAVDQELETSGRGAFDSGFSSAFDTEFRSPTDAATGSEGRFPSEPRTFIVRNAELREQAREHIQQAVQELRQVELRSLERILVDSYLLPDLHRLLAVIELRSDAVADVMSARQEIESTKGIIERVRDAFGVLGVAVVYGVLGNVVYDLAKLIADLS